MFVVPTILQIQIIRFLPPSLFFSYHSRIKLKRSKGTLKEPLYKIYYVTLAPPSPTCTSVQLFRRIKFNLSFNGGGSSWLQNNFLNFLLCECGNEKDTTHHSPNEDQKESTPTTMISNKPSTIECNIAQLNKWDYGNNHHLFVQHRDQVRRMAVVSRVPNTRGLLCSSIALQKTPREEVHAHYVRGQHKVRKQGRGLTLFLLFESNKTSHS